MYIPSLYDIKNKNYYEFNRLEMLQFIPKDAKFILDVGCASGKFGLEVKKQNNCLVWGVEPNKEAAELAKKNLDNVINSLFDNNTDFGGQKFDCIIFNDVLEHLVDPYSTIEICKKHLNPKGYIVSSIPNVFYYWNFIQNILQQDWKYEDAGIMDKTHLRFFSSKSIKKMFAESGGEIIKHEGINSYYSRKFKILNWLLLFKINSWQFQQFATVVKYK